MSKYIIFSLFILVLISCSKNVQDNLTITIIPRTEWKADPPKQFPKHVPDRITLHHEGTYFPQDSLAFIHIKNVQKWGMGPDRKWADIPYHFLIDGFGNIIEGRDPLTVGETNTSYDPSGHLLISVIGEYDKLQIPTESQIQSIIKLMRYLCIRYSVSPDSIKGHKDYCKPGETACPGNSLYKYLSNDYLKNEVKRMLVETN